MMEITKGSKVKDNRTVEQGKTFGCTGLVTQVVGDAALVSWARNMSGIMKLKDLSVVQG